MVTLNKHGYDFYEVKFTKSPITDSVVNEELSQLKNLQIPYSKLGFFSKNGFNLTNGNDYILIDIEDVYGE